MQETAMSMAQQPSSSREVVCHPFARATSVSNAKSTGNNATVATFQVNGEDITRERMLTTRRCVMTLPHPLHVSDISGHCL